VCLRRTLPIDHVGIMVSDMKNGFIGGERLTSNVALRK
jgi:hypothetical protein